MSWVTASSPAMNSAHSRAAQSRSRSVSDSQSARSREKSRSAGFQNLALPPANSFSGRLAQLSPPASSECERVRVMKLTSFRSSGDSCVPWGFGECVLQHCNQPAYGQRGLFGCGLVEAEDRIHAAHVGRQREVWKKQQ